MERYQRCKCLSVVVALLALPSLASAQQRQSAAEVALVASVQQVGASVTLYAEQKQREIAALEAQIAALKEKCGEPCK